MFIRKKVYEELKSDRDHYEKMADKWEDNYLKEVDKRMAAQKELEEKKNEENEEIKRLQADNEELQHKIDILYQYYNLENEPTQEERTKIRMDLRVHELEMENVELRSRLQSLADITMRNLGFERQMSMIRHGMFPNQSAVLLPYPYC